MNWRKLLVVPPLLIGVGLFVAQTRPATDDAGPPAAPAPTPVRVTAVVPEPFVARISGFGRVAPVREWEAISQVDGRIVELANGLAVGAVVAAGTPLIRVDARDYEIAQATAEANLASAEADLAEMNAQEENTRALLAVEREIETFLQAQFDRQQVLAQRGTVSQAALEEAHRELLNQRRQVLDLENQMALYPVQRISTRSTIQTREVELEEAQRDLENTTIAAPFRGRVTDQDLSVGEYVRPGDWLLTVEDMAAAEIVAEVQPGSFGAVLRTALPQDFPAGFEPEGTNAAFAMLRQFDLRATVHQMSGDRHYVWPATLDRHTGVVDQTTGTIGLVVRVEDPDRPVPAENRPPLNMGSFVEVQLEITASHALLMVDRSAVWTDTDGDRFVYVMDADETLQRRAITAPAIIDDRVIVAEGLSDGDIVVLSDPHPAIIGMALEPVYDVPATTLGAAP